ncbi:MULTISPECIES: fumarylacetoacetate hydrolase family protein [unclassified Novosphingobium]|uniref:fumarylacetoacetate hydrolase family protein n=1 Tax=unclassified Novosphingobium TaxID=2644732 RepID=UPI001447E12C|nr:MULTISPECIES: fumarylacetoacetate hydrolase family protein [unclassified Novosphingobium]NKJ45085.1 2-keto-4-pentenoate hydratase/2-oxohepta-3-ene-1,7-dioic acid hydratase in catechol pathway [Novosphingobium sp. SG720]NMN06439.1 2-keto-4-pentenoate hydratase/2-oxohepta-3-ene-1,7-dioic acid hydratase in catechol pathway [Novosphingobium sp. SG919]NMN89114.1 2-keto-4-pentenoate hydratase/2-oxohepta-3-ene-1,7-dioic acid hydratase in catechol pathway [Novosphingobium sp. SG916]
MRLVRYGAVGAERPGLIDAQGQLRDLSAHVADITPDWLAPDRLAALQALDAQTLPVVDGASRLGTPFSGTRQFIAIGLNYSDHAEEAGMAVPAEPIMFTKGVSCIQGPNDDVRRPRGSDKMDWEVELGIVIGTRAAYVDKDKALNHVAGYVVCDDLSEREYQLDRLGSWDKGKGCDTFGPVGPWLVTRDEVGDVQNLGMWLDVNGQRMQTGNTRTMIFDCATIVSYVSQFMVLLPGDIITTGTPPGVGMGMKPPVFLKEGDVIELGIEKLGSQRHTVRAWNDGI